MKMPPVPVLIIAAAVAAVLYTRQQHVAQAASSATAALDNGTGSNATFDALFSKLFGTSNAQTIAAASPPAPAPATTEGAQQ